MENCFMLVAQNEHSTFYKFRGKISNSCCTPVNCCQQRSVQHMLLLCDFVWASSLVLWIGFLLCLMEGRTRTFLRSSEWSCEAKAHWQNKLKISTYPIRLDPRKPLVKGVIHYQTSLKISNCRFLKLLFPYDKPQLFQFSAAQFIV